MSCRRGREGRAALCRAFTVRTWLDSPLATANDNCNHNGPPDLPASTETVHCDRQPIRVGNRRRTAAARREVLCDERYLPASREDQGARQRSKQTVNGVSRPNHYHNASCVADRDRVFRRNPHRSRVETVLPAKAKSLTCRTPTTGMRQHHSPSAASRCFGGLDW